MDGEKLNSKVDSADSQQRDRFDELSRKIAEDYAGVPEELGMAEIDAAVRQERARSRKS